MKRILSVASLWLLFFSSHATTITWTNLTGGSFGTTANWSPNTVPGSGDLAIITNTGTYTVTLDNGRTVGGMQVGANSGGGTQTFTMNGNALTLSGNSIINTNGIFIVSANFTPFPINLTNNGTVTWTGGNVSSGNSGAIYNNGLWDAQGDNNLQFSNSGGLPTFYNAGIFRKSAGSGTTTLLGFYYFNTGTNDVETGTVAISNGGNNTTPGVFNTAGGATLVFSNSYSFNSGSQFTGTGTNLLAVGTFTLNGNITFTKLTETGGKLAGTHVLNGNFIFNGGAWNMGATTTIASGSMLNIANTLDVSGINLTNNGTVIWTTGAINDANSSTGAIYNNGLWDAQGDNSFNYVGGYTPVFYNAGIFRKSAGSGTTLFNNTTTFVNTGTLDVRSGTVSLAGGGGSSLPGMFNTASGTTLVFSNGYSFNSGSQFTGTGTNLLATGIFTLNGTITFTMLMQTGGKLAGNHVLNGNFIFNGGAWNMGATTTIASGSMLNIANTLDVSGINLTNNGTVIWAAGAINDANSATGAIYNNGLWDAQGDNSFNYGGGYTPVFYNAGIFRKSAGTGTTLFNTTTAFVNTGTLDVQSGTVNLNGSHYLTGGTINIGIISLSSFGKVVLSGAAGFTGNFSANLNGGYIPITNYTFAVITYGSLNGTFGSYNYPFADAWTNSYSPTTFSLYVFNARPILTSPTNQIVDELTLLTVTNTAIDLDVPTNMLTYMLLNPPAGAGIDGNGVITWIPNEAQGPGTNLITMVVTDNGVPSLSATNSFFVVINEINVPPVLSPLANMNINELTTLTLTNSAIDSDIPGNPLTYTLVDAPAGATIDTNGVITWTPNEAQGPSTNTFTTVVTDTNIFAVNTQSFTVTNTFTVVVNEVNLAPGLILSASTNIDELAVYSANAVASDADIPANTVTFALVSGPAGLTVSPAGAINWTPGEAQGPSTNIVTIRVTDLNPPAVNAISLSTTNSFQIVVNEVNSAPVLPVVADTNVNELATLTVTNSATDSDIPINALTYILLNPPAGAVIDTNGVITWKASEAQGPSTNIFTTVVTDTNGFALSSPSLSTTNTFTVVVNEVNLAPVLNVIADQAGNPGQIVNFTATATDADVPTNALMFTLISPPLGAAINSSSGLFSWHLPASGANTTNQLQVRVTDNGVPSLSDTKSFNVIINPLAKPLLLTAIAYANSHFILSVDGSTGPDYIIMASTNLTAWSDVFTNLSPTTPFLYTDTNNAGTLHQFYRVRLSP